MDTQPKAALAPSPSEPKSKPSSWYPYYVLAIISFTYMVAYIDKSIIYLLVEPMQRDLKISDIQMSLLQGVAFGLFYALSSLPIAALADRRNRRNIIVVGIALWSMMTFVCGYGKNFIQLFLARMGVGIGEAALTPSAMSMLPDYFTKDKLAKVNSFILFGGAVGSGLSLMVGGKLIDLIESGHPMFDILPSGLYSWQKAFMIVGLPGLLLALVLFLTVKEPKRGALSPDSTQAPDLPPVKVLPFMLEHKKTFLTLFTIFPLMSMMTYGWLAWLPTFFIRHYDMSAAESAHWYGIVTLTFALAGLIIGGIITDFFFHRGHINTPINITIISTTLMGLSGGLASFMPTSTGAFITVGVFLFFTSFFMILPLLCVQLISPPHLRARLVAILFLTGSIASTLGPTFIAMFTDLVFNDPKLIGRSLSVTAVVLGIPSVVIAFLGRGAFRRTYMEVNEK